MSERKVHFSEPIHHIEYLDKQWDTASRLARDGSDWIRMVADRQRFRDRIERAAETLNRVLNFEFRNQIYHQRFKNFTIPDSEETSNIEEPAEISTASTQRSIASEDVHKQQSQHLPQQRSQQNNRQRRRSKNNKRQKHRGRHRKKK